MTYNRHARKRWTKKWDAELRSLFHEFTPLRVIAYKLGRTVGACVTRLRVLR